MGIDFRKGLLHGQDQFSNFGEVAIMRGFGFDLLPQILNRVVVGGIEGQLVHREPIVVRLEKSAGLPAGVILGAIL